MCGFVVTNKNIVDTSILGKYLARRGPDHNEVFTQNSISFVHFLLSITGEKIVQPIVSTDATTVANGEIYNHQKFGYYASDCLSIIPAFLEFGDTFPQQLDGEFAIVLADWTKHRLILTTDTFATKPMYYSIERGKFGIATYQSALQAIGFTEIKKVPANTILELDLITLKVRKIGEVTTFSLEQNVNSFDPWVEAFDLAVMKRVPEQSKFFVSLSCGFDSGAIALTLNRNHVTHTAYTVPWIESMDILAKRKGVAHVGSSYRNVIETKTTAAETILHLSNNMEQLYFPAFLQDGRIEYSSRKMQHDSSSMRVGMVLGAAHADGYRVQLSGHGSDEIISDYGFNGTKFENRSNFGGKFPDDLASIFPWPSFYEGSQNALLMREEHVAGSFGIETRYPFLDKAAVQAFLSLTAKLKNSRYKSVVDYYLRSNKYPTEFDRKVGI